MRAKIKPCPDYPVFKNRSTWVVRYNRTFVAQNLLVMKKSAVPRNPTYFDKYIDLVEDLSVGEALQQSLHALDGLDRNALKTLGARVYAPGKWTIKDIIQHLSDCERVFQYRALRFARRDDTSLPGFDEELFAETAGANRRSLEELLDELRTLRQSSLQLFHSFDETALRCKGVMFRSELPVLAIGFIIAGHQIHHFNLIKERYLPLLENVSN